MRDLELKFVKLHIPIICLDNSWQKLYCVETELSGMAFSACPSAGLGFDILIPFDDALLDFDSYSISHPSVDFDSFRFDSHLENQIPFLAS